MTSLRVAADIGGTFTDIAAILEDGSLATRKLPSTPHDYGEAVVTGITGMLADHGLDASQVVEVLHGCTVATNAILEHKGARTALLTTAGFRDVLEMRRIRVPRLYEPLWEKPAPLVPRRLRLEITERMDARGNVLTALDPASIEAAIATLRRERVEAIAVCFLHSYVNPAHELAVGAALRAAFPDTFVTLSVEVLPEMREYERTSTTVINALVGPPVKTYLTALIDRLVRSKLPSRLLMMQSSGGILEARVVMEKPAQIVECGPAAGVIGAARFGGLSGLGDLITFDMGGTTAKASLIEDGKLQRTDEYEVGGGISLSSRLVKGGGYALKLPVIDISEVGAGGGSLVWLDKAGAMKVGPHSAGAVPGPACYGIGEEPTVSDANVVLGFLNPTALAGGTVPISFARAYAAIADKVAGPLGLSVLDAAHGIHQVATTLMMRAVKAVSTQRGRDPREFSLFAFGGNGGVHAASLAQALGMRRIVLPPGAGVFSAIGLLYADIELGLARAFPRPLATVEVAALEAAYAQLERDVADALGVAAATLAFRRAADIRYTGQAFELTIALGAGTPDPAALAAAFDAAHERSYGHHLDGMALGEIVTLRVAGALETTGQRRLSPPAAAVSEGVRARRSVYFGPSHGSIETPLIVRTDIGATPLHGPLVLEEYEGTAVVPPGAIIRRDATGNLIMTLGEQA